MTQDSGARSGNSTQDTLAVYEGAHKWLLIPMIVILVAFTPIYFLTFPSEPWGYHVHALSAITWYGFMITQPYLATHGQLRLHRMWGMIGLLFAGAFIATGLSIQTKNVFLGFVGGNPPVFPAEFFYGLTFTETLPMLGFAASVLMAIVKSKAPDEHAIWMLGTVFFGFMPAWLRLSLFPTFAFGVDVSLTTSLLLSTPIFVAVILYVGYRLGRLMHPMIIASSCMTFLMVATTSIGGLEWYQDFVTGLMKPLIPWPEIK